MLNYIYLHYGFKVPSYVYGFVTFVTQFYIVKPLLLFKGLELELRAKSD